MSAILIPFPVAAPPDSLTTRDLCFLWMNVGTLPDHWLVDVEGAGNELDARTEIIAYLYLREVHHQAPHFGISRTDRTILLRVYDLYSTPAWSTVDLGEFDSVESAFEAVRFTVETMSREWGIARIAHG